MSQVGGTAFLLGAMGLAAQVMWVAHRRLPSLQGIDASGLINGPGERPPLRLLLLGDSTLTGPGLTNPDEIWLRRAVLSLDLDRPVEVISRAVGGSRVADVRRILAEGESVPADLAVVAVGSNDAIHGTPASQFERDLGAVLEELLGRLPVVAVANVGDLGNIARVPAPLNAVLRRRSRTISRAVNRVVAQHDRAVLLDVQPADARMRDRSIYGADLFHPGPEGHSAWAEVAVPGLAQAFDLVLAGDQIRP